MNYYVKVLSENGVFVFMLFLFLVISIFRNFQLLSFSVPFYKYVMCSFILLNLNMLTIDSFGLFFILVGLSMVVSKDCKNCEASIK